MYKQKKIYLCYYEEGPFRKIWHEWYSLVVKGFRKFIEDIAFSTEQHLNKYGKTIQKPPYNQGLKKDGHKYFIEDTQNSHAYIFYPQEWTTELFYEIVSEFHPSLHQYLTDSNFTLESREMEIDENSIVELQDLIQESIFIDMVEKIQRSGIT